jgi:hypothetical protein
MFSVGLLADQTNFSTMQTPIVPVAVYPATANTLYIRSIGLGPPPSYYYELQNVDQDGTVTVLKSGNVSMTLDQWDNWAAGPVTEDEPYQLDCISANLGLTRA